MTDTVQPTDSERETALCLFAAAREAQLFQERCNANATAAIAQALADQRARYEAIADELLLHSRRKGMPAEGSYDRGVQLAQIDAAERIRGVSR